MNSYPRKPPTGPAREQHNTARIPATKMTRPPTDAEVASAQEGWVEKWEEDCAARQQKETDNSLQSEWMADEALAAIAPNLRLMPGMGVGQLEALVQTVYGASSEPRMWWLDQVRRQRDRDRMPEMPAQYLADFTRLHRRLAFVAKLKSKRPVPPTSPPKRPKPALKRRD